MQDAYAILVENTDYRFPEMKAIVTDGMLFDFEKEVRMPNAITLLLRIKSCAKQNFYLAGSTSPFSLKNTSEVFPSASASVTL